METDQESDEQEHYRQLDGSVPASSSPLRGDDCLDLVSICKQDESVALNIKAGSPPCLWDQDDCKPETENAPKQMFNNQAENAPVETQKLATEEDSEGEECRVCHLQFDCESAAGETMQLGCDCKDDLSLAHRQCAEAWFKIKGNRTCEICGAIAQNVKGLEDISFIDQWNDRDEDSAVVAESARCCQSQPLCNFLLACMVVAFIVPWLLRVALF